MKINKKLKKLNKKIKKTISQMNFIEVLNNLKQTKNKTSLMDLYKSFFNFSEILTSYRLYLFDTIPSIVGNNPENDTNKFKALYGLLAEKLELKLKPYYDRILLYHEDYFVNKFYEILSNNISILYSNLLGDIHLMNPRWLDIKNLGEISTSKQEFKNSYKGFDNINQNLDFENQNTKIESINTNIDKYIKFLMNNYNMDVFDNIIKEVKQMFIGVYLNEWWN